MEKLKLPIDGLRVETFAPGERTDAVGTVNALEAADAGEGCRRRTQTGCNPDFTQVNTSPCCP